MCGRYNFSAEDNEEIRRITREIQAQLDDSPESGEISPTCRVPVLVQAGPVLMTWGFPHFKGSGVIINARSETALDKKMFRDCVLSRRCVVPSTGFFEWSRNGAEKTRHLFRLPGQNTLYMAGIWNTFRDKAGREQRRFVILTTAANDSMREDPVELSLFPDIPAQRPLIHDRMPVVLRPDERSVWLDGGADLNAIFDRRDIALTHVPA